MNPTTRTRDRSILLGIAHGNLWSFLLGLVYWRSLWSVVHLARLLWVLPDGAADQLIMISLPHHTSSEGEVDRMISQVIDLISDTQMEPDVVTISRSVGTGFTPEDVWERVECKLVDALKSQLEGLKVGYNKDTRDRGKPDCHTDHA